MELFVVGAGYVGLTTAVGFSQLGHRVTVHDIDVARVATLAAGRSPILEAGMDGAIAAGVAAGTLAFTTEPEPPRGTSAAIVCVPTPAGSDGLLDTSIVEAVVGSLAVSLPAHVPIVVRSTLPLHGPDRLEAATAAPGKRANAATAATAAGGATDASGAAPGRPVIVNPEFMREGRALADFAAPSRVVIGYLRESDREAAGAFAELYAPLGAPLVLADARSVVLLKLASNVYLGLKVAFADELARLADAIGADVSVVADGIGMDPRIGRSFLDSGPGFGGSCLPEQAAAIAVEAGSRDLEAPILQAVWPSNRTHQAQLVATVGSLLPAGLDGARVALLGLAFKANTDDVRHSPGLALAAELRAAGATVIGFDPVANEAAARADADLAVAPSAVAAAAGVDAVVVATEWPAFAELDWAAIKAAMRGDLVYDTRRILAPDAVRAAGLRYRALGKPAEARP
ncbi:MAG TPA: nucleotide sugar dehydrogenase [Candidatus Limnocylindrales bacterium]